MKENQTGERIFPDPSKAKKILNEYGENAPNWPYREEKVDLDRMAGLLKNDLIDPVLLLHRLQMPDVVVGFDDAGNQNILAFYRKVPNAHGIPDEVIFNTAQYETVDGKVTWRYGKWSQYETLAHEMAHGLLNYIAKIENRTIPAHGKEFCNLLEKWGLHPVPNIGAHYQVANADSPFGRLMRELGIARPNDVPRDETKPIKTDWFRPKKEKGRSSIHKWGCPQCGEIWYATRKDPVPPAHPTCGVIFVRLDGVPQTLYQAPEPDLDSERNQEEIEKDTWANYNPWEDPEDLGASLEAYQNGQEEY